MGFKVKKKENKENQRIKGRLYNKIAKHPLSTQVKAKAVMEKTGAIHKPSGIKFATGVKEKASTEIKKLKDNLKQQMKRTGTYLPKLEKETRKKVFKIKNELKRNNININKTMKKDLKLLMEYGTDAQRAMSFMRKTSETGKKPKAIRTVTTDKKGKIISKSKPVAGRFNMGVTREMPYDRPSKPANPEKSDTYSKKEVQKITGKKADGTIKYKKAGGIIKKDVGGKVSLTEQKRRARNKAIVPAMKAKKASLSKIRKKGDTKKLLQRVERGTRKGIPSAQSLAGMQDFFLLPLMKSMSRSGNKKYFIDGKSSFERQVDPKLKGSIKGNKYLSSFANKLGMTTSEFEKEYSKHFKKYEGTKITPKDTESIMKKIKTISKKYNSPVPKKITPAKQKVINQAAPVIKRIVKGDKRKVTFTPKPERPLSPTAKQRQIIKQSKKAGGGQVKNRNMGGVIGGGLGSQDVVDYLYKYKS